MIQSWLEDNPEPAIEPAIGYRGWRTGDSMLTSFTDSEPWLPGQKKIASCRIKDAVRPYLRGALPTRWRAIHRSPEPACTCGIYSNHRLLDALKLIRGRPLACAGAVSCWGRVVIHQEGLRAQFAALLALYVPPTLPAISTEFHLIETLADLYRVPMFIDPYALVAFATEFGVSYAPLTD